MVGKPEVSHPAEFKNRLLESNHSARFNPNRLKLRVQNSRGSAEKFENRLLGPTKRPQLSALSPALEIPSQPVPIDYNAASPSRREVRSSSCIQRKLSLLAEG